MSETNSRNGNGRQRGALSSPEAADAIKAGKSVGKATAYAAAGNYVGAAKEVAQGAGSILRIVGSILMVIILLVVFLFSIPQTIIGDIKEVYLNPIHDVSSFFDNIVDGLTEFFGWDLHLKGEDKVAKQYSHNYEMHQKGYEEKVYEKIEEVLDTVLVKSVGQIDEIRGNGKMESPRILIPLRKEATANEGYAAMSYGGYHYVCELTKEGDGAKAIITEFVYDEAIAEENRIRIANGEDPSDLPSPMIPVDACSVYVDDKDFYTKIDMVLLLCAWTVNITETKEEAINYEWKQKDFEKFYAWLDHWGYYLLGAANKSEPEVIAVDGNHLKMPWWTTGMLIELMEIPAEKEEYIPALSLISSGILEGSLRRYHQLKIINEEKDYLTHDLDEKFEFANNRWSFVHYFVLDEYESEEKNAPWVILSSEALEVLEKIDVSDINVESFPMNLGWITSPFGVRYLNGKREFHNGIDMVAQTTHGPIFAAFDGVVEQVEYYLPSRGTTVVMKHDNAVNESGERPYPQYDTDVFYTTYQHLSNVAVKKGRLVNSGITIGKQGGDMNCADDECRKGAGYSTGHHLHFAVSKNNPLKTGDRGAKYYNPIFISKGEK